MITTEPTEEKPVTWGFGKPFIMPKTTPELWAWEAKHDIPKTPKEAALLIAVQTELANRKRGVTPSEMEQTISDLEGEIDEKDTEISDLESAVEKNDGAAEDVIRLEKENDTLAERVDVLKAEVKELREGSSF